MTAAEARDSAGGHAERHPHRRLDLHRGQPLHFARRREFGTVFSVVRTRPRPHRAGTGRHGEHPRAAQCRGKPRRDPIQQPGRLRVRTGGLAGRLVGPQHEGQVPLRQAVSQPHRRLLDVHVVAVEQGAHRLGAPVERGAQDLLALLHIGVGEQLDRGADPLRGPLEQPQQHHALEFRRGLPLLDDLGHVVQHRLHAHVIDPQQQPQLEAAPGHAARERVRLLRQRELEGVAGQAAEHDPGVRPGAGREVAAHIAIGEFGDARDDHVVEPGDDPLQHFRACRLVDVFGQPVAHFVGSRARPDRAAPRRTTGHRALLRLGGYFAILCTKNTNLPIFLDNSGQETWFGLCHDHSSVACLTAVSRPRFNTTSVGEQQ
jgi:hypothetical protein